MNNYLDLLKTLIKEQQPNVDVRSGTVMNEFVLSTLAMGMEYISTELEKKMSLLSLSYFEQNEATESESSFLDKILANWNVSRKTGTPTTGKIIIELSDKRDIFFSETTLFTYNGYQFQPIEFGTKSGNEMNYNSETNRYYFVAEVESVLLQAIIVKAGSKFSTNLAIGAIKNIESTIDFNIGSSIESNKDYISRAKRVIGITGMYSKQSIESIIDSQFNVKKISILGFNDKEQIRDVNRYGIRTGKKVDIHVKTEPVEMEYEITTDSLGFAIIPSGDPLLRINNYYLSDNPNKKYQVNEYIISSQNIYLSATNARFTKYESIKFATGFYNKSLVVSISAQTQMQELYSFIEQQQLDSIYGDYLLKTFVPCFVNIVLELGQEYEPYENDIEVAVISHVNNTQNNILYVSNILNVIMDTIYSQNSSQGSINIKLPLVLNAKFYLPSGAIYETSSDNKIEIPNMFDLGVSSKNVTFYVTPSDVEFSYI